jgi:hypothetical protein
MRHMYLSAPSKDDNIHSPVHNPDHDEHRSLLAWLAIEELFLGVDIAFFHQELGTIICESKDPMI